MCGESIGKVLWCRYLGRLDGMGRWGGGSIRKEGAAGEMVVPRSFLPVTSVAGTDDTRSGQGDVNMDVDDCTGAFTGDLLVSKQHMGKGKCQVPCYFVGFDGYGGWR